jgi:hemerythrin superfamily protein
MLCTLLITIKINLIYMPNPITLIKEDHKKVEQLFTAFNELGEGDAGRKEDIAKEIIKELAVHAKMEEKYFYPRLKEVVGVDHPKMIEDALAEHHAAKALLLELRVLAVDNPKYASLMKVLEDSVMHHVDEEETTLLPLAEEFFEGKAMDEIGKEMAKYKEEAHKGLLEKILT